MDGGADLGKLIAVVDQAIQLPLHVLKVALFDAAGRGMPEGRQKVIHLRSAADPDDRHVLYGGQDKQMQATADHQIEPAGDRQDFPRLAFPLDDHGKPIKGIQRHPIVEDDVIIYGGATILGRVTIGRGAVIGGNVWLTRDVPSGYKITQQAVRQEQFIGGGGI